MLAGAIQQYLKAQGMSPVTVGYLPDFTQAALPAIAVVAFSDRDAELSDGAYSARVQLRSRAADAVAAENVAREALDTLLAADGLTLEWDDPTSPPTDRSYLVEAISIVNRPTWFPTSELGEETSCNVEMLITEV